MEKGNLTNCSKLIDKLRNSNEIQQIHSLSLDISDQNCKDGLNEIMNKIADRLTFNYRGTLLYACSVYDCSDYFSIIISNIILGPYETAVEAYNLIIDNIDYKKITQEHLKESIKRLCTSNDELDHIEIIEETINFLKKKQK